MLIIDARCKHEDPILHVDKNVPVSCISAPMPKQYIIEYKGRGSKDR